MIHVFDGILLSHKKGNNAICSNMDELETVILSEVREEEIPHDIPYMQNLKRNDTNELMVVRGNNGRKGKLGSLESTCTYCYI